MKEEQKHSSGSSVLGLVIFFSGFIVALAVGWIVFPSLLFSERIQPINFSHAAHQDSTCEDCHAFRPDGTYTGIPQLDKCKECHESQLGQSESERILVEEYIAKDREIPWLVYAYQPDNVFFSHAAHKAKNVPCVRCHRDVAKEQKLPAYRENRLTGYSEGTMKMIECEECHAAQSANNDCGICHK
ncbi:MAG TPA: cytochrome c3 family protein [Syntrophobacteraceae bacterium]|nr:cytochrome c3 family protein [Syntrophobacteraceae bacterium]